MYRVICFLLTDLLSIFPGTSDNGEIVHTSYLLQIFFLVSFSRLDFIQSTSYILLRNLSPIVVP